MRSVDVCEQYCETDTITINTQSWVSFGKKNSHILRSILFKRFTSQNMSKEAIFWIYFFHSLIKDKERILIAIDTHERMKVECQRNGCGGSPDANEEAHHRLLGKRLRKTGR